jgi:hypothetical protein
MEMRAYSGRIEPSSGMSLGDINAEAMSSMITQLVTQAYGTKLPQRRNPDNES